MRLVHGFGINDANYTVTRGTKHKTEWRCPFYSVWAGMLQRCYSAAYHAKKPSYKECSVCDEWLSFMRFRAWMEKQNWEGKELDKDLLVSGNKVYSPETCYFVVKEVNMILTSLVSRKTLPCGVYETKFGTFYAKASFRGSKYLGCYNTVNEAEQAYLAQVRLNLMILASEQEDSLIKNALINKAKEVENDNR